MISISTLYISEVVLNILKTTLKATGPKPGNLHMVSLLCHQDQCCACDLNHGLMGETAHTAQF